jgi:hypothetical protein
MGTLFVDKLDPQSGTALEIGSNGDTITIPSGCTITNSGTDGGGFGGDNKPILSVGLSSTQSMSDNTWTTIVFQTEILDAGGIYNNSTGIATPTAGTYLMIFAANVGGGGSSTLQDAGVKFLIGGSDTTAEQTCNAASNNQSYVNLVTSYVMTFDGSTTVACQAYNNVSSGTPSVYGGGNPRFGATFQMIKLIS